MKYLIVPLTCLFLFSFPYSSHANAQLERARSLFDAGRYWDAYLECSNGGSDFTTLSLLEDSKKAMIIQQKYRIHRDLKQYPLAIQNLESLLLINPKDPDKPDLGIMAYMQARILQRQALNQLYRVEAERKLSEAVTYYQQAMREGVPSREIIPKLKVCEKQLNHVRPLNEPEIFLETPQESNIPEQQQADYPTSENVPVKMERKVLILDNQNQ